MARHLDPLLHCRFLKKMSQSGTIMRSAILTVNVQNYYAAVNQGIAVSDTDIGLLKAILLLVQDVFKVSSPLCMQEHWIAQWFLL
jgi:hypothetical protein